VRGVKFIKITLADGGGRVNTPTSAKHSNCSNPKFGCAAPGMCEHPQTKKVWITPFLQPPGVKFPQNDVNRKILQSVYFYASWNQYGDRFWTILYLLPHNALTIHQFFTVSLWAQNLPFQKIFSYTCSTIVCICQSEWSHGSRPITDISLLVGFYVWFHFILISVISHARQTKLTNSLVKVLTYLRHGFLVSDLIRYTWSSESVPTFSSSS